MTTRYWSEAAHANDGEIVASLQRFAQLSQEAMTQFQADFPGAPCLLSPCGHMISFQLDFAGTIITVRPAPPQAGYVGRWWLSRGLTNAYCDPREGAAGLFRACRHICPRSVFEEDDAPDRP